MLPKPGAGLWRALARFWQRDESLSVLLLLLVLLAFVLPPLAPRDGPRSPLTTAIFTALSAVLLKPLPYPHPEDLYSLRTALTDGRVTTGLLSGGEIYRLNDPNLSIERAAGFQPADLTLLAEDDTPTHVKVYLVSDGFFELFGLPAAFALDAERLEMAYREIQSRVHPDRFAHAGDAERRASLQWTTRVNEAFRTLRNPVARAKHLLELHGVDVAFETNTAMPPEFLMQQMELRESLEDAKQAKDYAALEALQKGLREQKAGLEAQIARAIDADKDYAGAAGLVRKLMFLEKMREEIDLAYEAVE